MRLLRNNAFIGVLFIVLLFINAHAITAGWYR